MIAGIRFGVRRPVAVAVAVLVLATTVGVLLPSAPATAAGAGQLDPTWAGTGAAARSILTFDEAVAGALDSSGRYVVVTSVQEDLGPGRRVAVVRFNPDGSPDLTFGVNGIAMLCDPESIPDPDPDDVAGKCQFTENLPHGDEHTAAGLVVEPGPAGRIIVAANVAGDFITRGFLFALNSDGTLDTDGFGGGTGFQIVEFSEASGVETVHAIGRQSDGRLIVGLRSNDGDSGIVVKRYVADGTEDPTFGTGGGAFVGLIGFEDPVGGSLHNLRVLNDDRILVVGEAAGLAYFHMLTPNGQPYSGFQDSGSPILLDLDPEGEGARATNVAVDEDAQIAYATVVMGPADGTAIVAFTFEGSTVNEFGADGLLRDRDLGSGNTRLPEIAVDATAGRVVVGGYTNRFSPDQDPITAAYRTADGRRDLSWGTGGTRTYPLPEREEIADLTLQPDGRVLAAGTGLTGIFALRLTTDQPPAPPPVFDDGDIVVAAGGLGSGAHTSTIGASAFGVAFFGPYLYFSNRERHLVWRVNLNTGLQEVYAGTGVFAAGPSSGVATEIPLRSPAGLDIDDAGNLYIAESSGHRVRKVTPTGFMTTIAGNGSVGGAGDFGPATAAQLNLPVDVDVSPDGSQIYILEMGGHRVRLVTVGDGAIIQRVIGDGTAGSNDGEFGRLNTPRGFAVDHDTQNVVIADTGNDTLREAFWDDDTETGWQLTTIAGTAGSPGESGDGGPAHAALLRAPSDVVFFGGELFVATTGRVRRIELWDGSIHGYVNHGALTGGIAARGGTVYVAAYGSPHGVLEVGGDDPVVQFTGNGQSSGGHEVSATDSTVLLNGPSALASFGSTYYLAEQGAPPNSTGGAIRAVNADGIITRLHNTVTRANGLAADATGNLYFTRGNQVFRRTPGGAVTTIAGTGLSGVTGDGGPATSATFVVPTGIAVSPDGTTVWVVDTNAHNVRRFTVGGTIQTVAGIGGVSGNGPNHLSAPRGVALAPDGHVYLTDTGNHRIQRIDPGGAVSTVIGTGVSRNFSTPARANDGVPAGSAAVRSPFGIDVDTNGLVYFSDGDSIRRTTPEGTLHTIVGQNDADPHQGIPGPAATATIGQSGVLELTVHGDDVLVSAHLHGQVYRVIGAVPDSVVIEPPPTDYSPSGRIVYDADSTFGNGNLYTIAPDGSDQVLVDSFGSDPAFSPDGTRIAFTSTRTGWPEVFVMNSDGSGAVNVTNHPAHDADVVWSPDGQRLAFTSDRDGPFDIWLMNPDGSNLTKVVGTSAWESFASWGPDSDTLVFQRNDGNDFEIWSKKLSTGDEVRLTNNAFEDQHPVVSPDGTKVAFQSDRNGTNFDIWVMGIDGSNQRRLTTDPIEERVPEWSPDGLRILYDAATELRVMHADGSQQTPIAAPGRGASSWMDNLTLSVGVSALPAQPAVVPAQALPVAGTAPSAVQSADLAGLMRILNTDLAGLLRILKTDLAGLLRILNTDLAGLLRILKTDLAGLLRILKTDLAGLLRILKTDLAGLLRILKTDLAGLLRILKTDLAGLLRILKTESLDKVYRTIRLDSIDVKGGWEAYLAGTALEGRAVQDVSLADVLAIDGLDPLLLEDLDVTRSVIGRLSLLGLSLGSLPLAAIDLAAFDTDWCEQLAEAGVTDCAAGLGGINQASLLSLELAGIDLEQLPVFALLLLGHLDWTAADTAVEGQLLSGIDMASSNLGGLRLVDLAQRGVDLNAVVNTTQVDVNQATLDDAQRLGAIRPAATVGDLLPGIGESSLLLTVLGFLPPEVQPVHAIATNSSALGSYVEPGADPATYTASFAPVGVSSVVNPRFVVSLPEGMVAARTARAVLVPPSGPEVTVEVEVDFSQGVPSVTAPFTVAAGSRVLAVLDVHPGLQLSTRRLASARVSAPGVDQSVVNRAPLAVTERFEPQNNVPASAPTLDPGTRYLTHIGTPGDVDYWRVNLQGGERIRLLLQPPDPAGGSADLDLILYGPPGSGDLPLRANTAPGDAIKPLTDGGIRQKGEPVSPDVLNDLDLLDAPVMGLSANRGGFNEGIDATAPITGTYVVQVSGYNGAHSALPYSLLVQTGGIPEPLVCSARVLPFDPHPHDGADEAGSRGTLPSSLPAGTRTLILQNRDRVHDLYGSSAAALVSSKAGALAASNRVGGAVLSVDADPDVRAAYAAWDASPCDPKLANGVVRAINDVVDRYTDLTDGSIENVVVMGSDEVIPFARIQDLTQTANERGYRGSVEFTGANALTGAFANGMVLSDDPYADGDPLPYLGRHLYVADVGIGRLVETPAEIAGQVDTYLADADGVLDPSTALTAGSDFMLDVSQDVHASLEQVAGSPQPSLINHDWTRSDFLAALPTGNPAVDVVSLNVHFRHNALEPARLLSPLASSDLVGTDVVDGAVTMAGDIIFTMGCHSGLNVADVLVGVPSPAQVGELRDFAQAFAAKGATYVAQTGFGYGLANAMALSETLMSTFARNLSSGAMTVGQALALAKQDYLGGLGVYGVYDEKVLAQTALYGLPFWRVGTADPAPVPAPPALSTDPVTGLPSAQFDISPAFTNHTTPEGRYYSVAGQTQVTHDRPIQPKVVLDVTQPGALRARGVMFTGLESVDEHGFDPLFARPTVSDGANSPEAQDPTSLYPATVANVTSAHSLHGLRDRVVLLPGRFQATGTDTDGHVRGTQRRYTRLVGRVLYSTSADVVAPTFQRIEAVKVGDSVVFNAVVADDDVVAVSAVFHLQDEAVWRVVQLNPLGDGHFTGTASIGGDGEIEYLAIAADNAGNTGYSTNKAELFAAVTSMPPPDDVNVVIDGSPAGNGWYTEATVVITAPESVPVEVSINDGPYQPYTGPIPITGEGVNVIRYRVAGSAPVTIYVPIDTTPPTVELRSPIDGAVYDAGSIVRADYSCADAGAGVVSCTGTVADGAPIDTRAVNHHTFTVTAVDGAGRTTSRTVTYRVRYRFEGFFMPTANPPAVNVMLGGLKIPISWRLFSGDDEVRSTNAVTRVEHFPIACPAGPQVRVVPVTITASTNTVTYHAGRGRFEYYWQTQAGWNGTCRRLEVRFKEGQVRSLIFRFNLL